MTPGMKALAEAARLEAARVYGQRQKETPRPQPASRLDQLIDRIEQMGPPVTRLAARRPTGPSTVVIEQAIARTGSVEAAARVTGADVDVVRRVFEAMSA